jgi:hypothetical protein
VREAMEKEGSLGDTKNNSMYVSMKVSFLVVTVIWVHNKKKIIFGKNNKIFKEFDIL